MRHVVDLGYVSGKLLKSLLAERTFKEIVGTDVLAVSLENAARRIRPETMPERQKEHIKLLHGALTCRDRSMSSSRRQTANIIRNLKGWSPGSSASLIIGSSGPASSLRAARCLWRRDMGMWLKLP